MTALRIPVALLLMAVTASAYVRFRTANGSPFHRNDYAQVSVRINDAVRAGMTNSSGAVMITADSDPIGAFQAALKSWSSVSGSAVNFAPLGPTSRGNDANDGRNVIVFGDTPEIRSVVGSALAVTLNMVMDDGRIVDSDTLFNPAYKFSTTLAGGTYDLQSVATHELGHVLGANHSTVLAATMFQSMPSSANLEARLSADDVAFAADAYPAVGAGARLGNITGMVSYAGAPVSNASVVAVDTHAGVAVAALSDGDGSFQIAQLPPGSYLVYAEPLNGPVLPANLYIPSSDVNTSFSTTFAGSAEAPQIIAVTGGSTARVDIAARPACTLRIAAVGTGAVGGSGDFTAFGTGAVSLVAGQAADLMLTGPGIDQSVLDGGVRLLGPGLSIRDGSLRIDPGIELNGMPIVRLTVDVAPRPTSAVATILVTKGAEAATYTGGLLIAFLQPSFTAQSLVNAANFHGGVVAPGEIVTLFGMGLGPGNGVQNSGFDPATGGIPTRLGGVTVTFDGIRAPLFYVSASQINLQVPYEVGGKSSTAVVVESSGVASTTIRTPVVASAPGIFTFSRSSWAIVLNQDGTLNSASAPAPRGSVVTLFSTGQGQVSPAVPTGQPAPSSVLARAFATSVTIGSVKAKIHFAGLTPGMVGLMQVNVAVPPSVTPGNSVTIQITVKGAASGGAATIAVK